MCLSTPLQAPTKGCFGSPTGTLEIPTLTQTSFSWQIRQWSHKECLTKRVSFTSTFTKTQSKQCLWNVFHPLGYCCNALNSHRGTSRQAASQPCKGPQSIKGVPWFLMCWPTAPCSLSDTALDICWKKMSVFQGWVKKFASGLKVSLKSPLVCYRGKDKVRNGWKPIS